MCAPISIAGREPHSLRYAMERAPRANLIRRTDALRGKQKGRVFRERVGGQSGHAVSGKPPMPSYDDGGREVSARVQALLGTQ